MKRSAGASLSRSCALFPERSGRRLSVFGVRRKRRPNCIIPILSRFLTPDFLKVIFITSCRRLRGSESIGSSIPLQSALPPKKRTLRSAAKSAPSFCAAFMATRRSIASPLPKNPRMRKRRTLRLLRPKRTRQPTRQRTPQTTRRPTRFPARFGGDRSAESGFRRHRRSRSRIDREFCIGT